MTAYLEAGLDAQPGELFLFPGRSLTTVYELNTCDGADRFVFVSKSDTSTFRLRREDFARLWREPNGALRIQAPANCEPKSFTYTDPSTFADPDAPGLSQRQRQRILTLKKDHRWALTVQFFTKKYDEASDVSRSDDGLDIFIASHSKEAESLGLVPLISASTLRKATLERGSVGDRQLHHFLPDKERRFGKFWDPFILGLKARLIDEFWHPKAPKLWEVQNNFFRRWRARNSELTKLGADTLPKPTEETLRLWINGAECYHRYKARHGARSAGRRYRGQSRAIQATRPLEYVMLDHTLVDAWAPFQDENGDQLLPERPWLVLAIDVFSRVILAAFLTFAAPSVYTVAEALKQMVRPKSFLHPDLLAFKNFRDFFGKPSFIIVDRAWENTGSSFQTMCESVGINIIWAPVRTPEFKCHVEHAFHDLNQIYWHRLPSGIPHRPHVMAQLGLNPRNKVDRDIKAMSDGLWLAIRKMAFRINDGIGMAPARAWMEGFREHKRPEIDDVTVFDGFLGKVRQCQLTTSGIKLENMRFHDPEITSGLLNDLLRYAKAKTQRRAPLSSGTIMVTVVQDVFCDHVHVWNPRKRQNISLPNTLPEYSRGLTWQEHKAVREYAKKENLEFCSEEEMLEVSHSLAVTYKSQVDELPYKEARKLARKYQPGRRLVPGSIVEEAWEEPSDTGMGSQGIQHIIPASRRTDERKIPKITPRGGTAASKKAAATKRRRREQLKGVKAQSPSPTASEMKTPKDDNKYSMWGVVEDSTERLARLAATLGPSTC